MTGYGAAAALLVLIVSRLARHTGYNILFALAAATSFVQLVVLYRWTPTKNDRLLIYLFPLSWGIGEAVWETQINCKLTISFSLIFRKTFGPNCIIIVKTMNEIYVIIRTFFFIYIQHSTNFTIEESYI